MAKLDAQKALESILYIADRVKEPTYHKIAKVLYFADQKHIVRYGRFITGDNYVAMEYGPVPSHIYKTLKDGKNTPSNDAFRIVQDYNVFPEREADLDEFSDSDIECLSESIAENGHLSFDELVKKSHDAVYDSALLNHFISIEAFFRLADNPQALSDYYEANH